MQEICGFTLDELKIWMEKNGEKPFRAPQILDWIYNKQVLSFEEMTNLSKELKAKLKASFGFPLIQCVRTLESEDKETVKFLWQLACGKKVESVLILSELLKIDNTSYLI